MQAGISTASYYVRHALEDIPARIRAEGAEIAEVFLNTFSEYEPEFIALLAERLRENGLSVYSAHPMGSQFEPQLFSLHPRQRADALAIFERVLKAARTLGARYYIMHGPARMHGAVRNMELQRIGPLLGELCAMAGEYGIEIAWENVSWCLFSEPFFAQRMAEACPTDALRFTLDVKQAARSGYAPEDYLRAIAAVGEGRLVNVHLCDYTREGDRFRAMLPGSGACDFPALFQALQAVGYDGPVFLEVYSDLYREEAELSACFQMLKRMLAAMQ